MTGLPLRDLHACFEGVIPSIIATVDAAGVPNISYLSHVHYVDEDHVALSNQYFTKTSANVRDRGTAALIVVDGRGGRQYLLDIAFVSSHREGALFERMSDHLNAMSSRQGMSDIMALRSADLYRVLRCEAVPAVEAGEEPVAAPPDAGARLAAAARLAGAIARDADADAMIDHALRSLAEDFGFPHLMVLIPDDSGARLTVIASRGYETPGTGAEVAVGEGVVGTVAATLRPLRLADMSRGRRYAEAARTETPPPRAIPYPGLAEPLSQMAVPMISRGELIGVLMAEAATRFAFAREDEDAIALVAGQLGAALALHDMASDDVTAAKPAADRVTGPRIRIRYFPYDDSIFIGEDYLIRGISGRLLHHFLRLHLDEGRNDFTNRELRVDPRLRLPEVKDNLETRLILLRRRLEEHAAPLRLLRPERGRIRLEIGGTPEIEIVT